MKDAEVEGNLVVAGEESAEEGVCPACGEEVHKRRRTRMDGSVSYYYRHVDGRAKECPRRYRPR